MFELRPYQNQLIADIRTAWPSLPTPKRCLFQMATGGGKTPVLMTIAKQWKGRRVLWITHRTELAEQAYKTAKDWGVPRTKLHVWTPIKLRNQIKKYKDRVWRLLGIKETDLMIIDEAHHATATTWAQCINSFPGSVIGTTATTWRMSKREGFNHLFDILIKGPSLYDLTEDNWLAPIRAWHAPGIKIEGKGATAGDFNIKKTTEAMTTKANADAVDWCLKMIPQHGVKKKIIAFCLTIEHAKFIAQTFNDKGCTAGIVSSKSTHEERKQIVQQFAQGDLQCLCNVNICTEGVDIPDASVILILRPTKSLALFLQMIGRGSRKAPDKDFCMVLDTTDNIATFGLPAEVSHLYPWSLEPRGETQPGDAPTKQCPKCFEIHHTARVACHAPLFDDTGRPLWEKDNEACDHTETMPGHGDDDVWCVHCDAKQQRCDHIFMAPCRDCGKNKPVKELKENVCKACRADHKEAFDRAQEVEPLRLKIKVSQAGNKYANYQANGLRYTMLVMPSKFAQGQYGWRIYTDKSTHPLSQRFAYKSEDNAIKAAKKQLYKLVMLRENAEKNEWKMI